MFKIKKLPNEDMYGLYYKGDFVKGGYVKDLKNDIADTKSKGDAYKEKFHCLDTCTECCQQHIDLIQSDLFKIRRALRKMPENEIERLKNQDRNSSFCPLLDVQKGACSVYESRPNICKEFCEYTGAMSCSYNLDIELKNIHWFFHELLVKNEKYVGKLGKDFTWEKGLIK